MFFESVFRKVPPVFSPLPPLLHRYHRQFEFFFPPHISRSFLFLDGVVVDTSVSSLSVVIIVVSPFTSSFSLTSTFMPAKRKAFSFFSLRFTRFTLAESFFLPKFFAPIVRSFDLRARALWFCLMVLRVYVACTHQRAMRKVSSWVKRVFRTNSCKISM